MSGFTVKVKDSTANLPKAMTLIEKNKKKGLTEEQAQSLADEANSKAQALGLDTQYEVREFE